MRPNRLILVLLATCAVLVSQDAPAREARGLRMSLAMVDGNTTERLVEVTIHNTGPRDYYLPLGTIGSDALAIRLVFTPPGSAERNVLRTPVRTGAAPSRSEPIIVPLLSGSSYAIRYPLSQLYYMDQKRRPLDDSSSGTLRALLAVDSNQARQYVACFGLNIFWSGTLASNTIPLK